MTAWGHLYLPKSHLWFIRTMRLPERPTTGDRGPVIHALRDIVDAAGMLEYSRGALHRTIDIAQQEWEELTRNWCDEDKTENWTGVSTRAVYYEFYAAVTWTRTVRDRFQGRLRPALQHDPELWKELQRIRSEEVGPVFEYAGHLAGCCLHNFTPPYPNFGCKVVGGTLIYPIVDRIIDKTDYRRNLCFDSGRHAAVVVDQFWEAVARFIDRLLDVFYPAAP